MLRVYHTDPSNANNWVKADECGNCLTNSWTSKSIQVDLSNYDLTNIQFKIIVASSHYKAAFG